MDFAQRAGGVTLCEQLRQHGPPHTLELEVEREIPTFRAIDRDPRWHQWLTERHRYSGFTHRQLLDDSVRTGNAHRVISLLRSFQQAVAAGRATAPAPSQWGYAASPRDRPVYSRADINAASRAYMKGAYRGREAEYEALQADIIRAAREGRISDAPQPKGKARV